MFANSFSLISASKKSPILIFLIKPMYGIAMNIPMRINAVLSTRMLPRRNTYIINKAVIPAINNAERILAENFNMTGHIFQSTRETDLG